MRKYLSLVIGVLLVISSIGYTSDIVRSTGGRILYVGGVGPGNYTSIQSAIDDASDGDTIFVYPGIYRENLVINKSINLIGANKSTTIIMADKDSGDSIHPFQVLVKVAADKVNISNLTIIDNFTTYTLYIDRVKKISILNSDFIGRRSLSSICITQSSRVTLKSNTLINASISVWWSSEGIRIIDNTLNNKLSNGTAGISISFSRNVTLHNNTLLNCSIFVIDDVSHLYTYAIDTSNTVNGKPVYFWVDRSGENIPENAGEVILVNCSGVTINNLTLSNVTAGVIALFCKDLLIANSTFSDSLIPIFIMNTSRGKISDCVIRNDFRIFTMLTGIEIIYSDNMTIVNNTLFNSDVWIVLSSSNILKNNSIYRGGITISASQEKLYWISHHIDDSNKINDMPMCYLKNATGETIYQNYGQIILVNCSDINIENQSICNTSTAVLLALCTNITVENSRIFKNNIGICFAFTTNSTIRNNFIVENNKGMATDYFDHFSQGNLIYNNYFNNTINTWGLLRLNRWNITKTPGKNIIGGPYLGGNYWSDYRGYDINGDGLGDTNVPYPYTDLPYGDYLPLTTPNYAPVANFSYYPKENLTTKDTISFNSASYDIDGKIVNFTWHLGDGTVVYGENISYRYPNPGVYNVTLIVRDDVGAENSTTRQITISLVDSNPPFLSIERPKSGHLYIRCKEIRFPFKYAWIIGEKFDIEITAYDNETDIDKVEYYLDGKLIYRSVGFDNLYGYYPGRSLGKLHTIEVKVYDKAGNMASEKIKVRIFSL
ncbi:MAG TPA: PKD domain-containing protein [Thermoplasmatales archaeon]|nr:PKD domain-containing protein [Thermoplasmatales archaeon]